MTPRTGESRAGGGSRPATIVDVARVAGVSRQTVTRALHDMAGISPATRDRVLAAARELRYHPSRFGRGLVKPSARTLGLLVGDLANPYYAELASTVLRLAGDAGWNVVMAEPGNAADLAAGADAVLSFTGVEFVPPAAGAPNLPVVELAPPRPAPGRGRVDLEMSGAVRDAVEHLVERGVRRPVVLDPRDPPGSGARAAAFTAEFARHGVRAAVAAVTSELAADRPVDLPDGTDAVVAFNDLVAFGVLRRLRLAGIDVPGQVRVLGVDGLSIGAYVTPRLSTLAMDMTQLARTGLDLVLAIAAGTLAPDAPAAVRSVPYVFRAAETT